MVNRARNELIAGSRTARIELDRLRVDTGRQDTISERTARIELIVYEWTRWIEYDFQNKEIEDKIYAKEIAGDIHAMKQRHDDLECRFAKLEEQLHLPGDIRRLG